MSNIGKGILTGKDEKGVQQEVPYTIINFSFDNKELEEADNIAKESIDYMYQTLFKDSTSTKLIDDKKMQMIIDKQKQMIAEFNKEYLLSNKKAIQENFPFLQELLKLVYTEIRKKGLKTEKRKKADIETLPDDVKIIECKSDIEAPFSNEIYREALQGFLLGKRTDDKQYIYKTKKNSQGFQKVVAVTFKEDYEDVELTFEDLQVLSKIESIFIEYKEQVSNKHLDTYSLTIKKADYQNLLNKNIRGVRLNKIFKCLDKLKKVYFEVKEYTQYKKYLPNKLKIGDKLYYDKTVYEEKLIFRGRLLDYYIYLNKNNDYTITFVYPLFEKIKLDNNINRYLIPQVNELSLKEALEYQIARKLSSLIFIRKGKLISTNSESGIYEVEIKYSTLLDDLNIEQNYIRDTKEATNEYLKRFQNKITKSLEFIKDINIDKCIIPRASMTTYKSTKIIVAFNYDKRNLLEV